MSTPPDPAPGMGFDAKRPGGEMKSSASGAPTRSQLLPFGGQWQELMTKPYFMPGVVLCVVVAVLFALLSRPAAMQVMLYGVIPVDVPVSTIVLALCITAGGAFGVYRMAGKPKAWWLMPLVAVFTALLVSSPVIGVLQGFFGIGAGSAVPSDSVIVAFVKMIFRAGLPEETLKAIPVAIGVVIGWKLLVRRDSSGLARQLAVLDPLDGILIGVASGFGFAFAETVFQYVPSEIVDSTSTTRGLINALAQVNFQVHLPQNWANGDSQLPFIIPMFNELAKRVGVTLAAFELQQMIVARQGIGLELMIPRLLSDVFGHAAYAGIFGYFIGLAAMKPKGRVKTVLIGLAVAATIHAMWDSMAHSLFMYFLLSLLAFVGLAITIMKARTLAPDRSQLVASQIIDRFTGSHFAREHFARETPRNAPSVASQAGQASWPGAAGVAAVTPRAPAASAPAVYRPEAAAPASITWDDDSNLRYIELGTARLPATVGARLYERNALGIRASGNDGVIAEVNANPNDATVLGLKNLSDQVWHVSTAQGQQRDLAPGRSIRLEAGLTIRIGELTAHVR